MTDLDGRRRPRRRRVADYIDVGYDLSEPWDADQWSDDLRDRLNSTAEYYDRRPSTPQNERRRLAAELGTVVTFLMANPVTKDAKGIENIALLKLTLEGVNAGRVHPLLEPVKGARVGRTLAPADFEFRAHVLAATSILSDAGIEDPEVEVAKLLYNGLHPVWWTPR